PAPYPTLFPPILPVTVTPVSVPPLIVPPLPTLPIVPPLIVPELGEASSTAFIVPLKEPIDMPVIVPAPCATIVPAMLPVTVTPVIVPPLIVPPLPSPPRIPPLVVTELGEASSTASIVPLSEPIDMPV